MRGASRSWPTAARGRPRGRSRQTGVVERTLDVEQLGANGPRESRIRSQDLAEESNGVQGEPHHAGADIRDSGVDHRVECVRVEVKADGKGIFEGPDLAAEHRGDDPGAVVRAYPEHPVVAEQRSGVDGREFAQQHLHRIFVYLGISEARPLVLRQRAMDNGGHVIDRFEGEGTFLEVARPVQVLRIDRLLQLVESSSEFDLDHRDILIPTRVLSGLVEPRASRLLPEFAGGENIFGVAVQGRG